MIFSCKITTIWLLVITLLEDTVPEHDNVDQEKETIMVEKMISRDVQHSVEQRSVQFHGATY